MKKSPCSLLFCLVLLTGRAHSQILPTLYFLDGDVEGFRKVGATSSESFKATAGWYFWKKDEQGGKWKVEFARHKDSEQESLSGYVKKDSVYEIESAQLEKPFLIVQRQGTNLGVLTVPGKLRLSAGEVPSTLAASASVGPFLGYKLFIKDGLYLTPLIFAGFSTLALNDSASKAAEENLGYTFGFGAVFELGQAFQLGSVVGFDKAFGGNSSRWPFEKRPWVSVAIGFRFLN